MGTNAFTTNYNVGGDIDRIKNLKRVETVDNINEVTVVDEVKNIDDVAVVENVNDVQAVERVAIVNKVGEIKNFATFSQPYSMMKKFDIPGSYKDPVTLKDYEFEVTLPNEDIEILAITVTCSGYGEEDNYDLYFNDEKWFDTWYCSEVREGLFLGTSTYVYAAPADSKIKLIFRNESGSSKILWLGVRMLKEGKK